MQLASAYMHFHKQSKQESAFFLRDTDFLRENNIFDCRLNACLKVAFNLYMPLRYREKKPLKTGLFLLLA